MAPSSVPLVASREPAPPSTVAWSDSQVEVVERWREGELALLRPQDPRRERRWRRVFGWYARAGSGTRNVSPERVGDHRVVAVGDRASVAAPAVAAVLARDHLRIDDLSPRRFLADNAAGSSVLVVADRQHLTCASLAAISRRARETETTVGFLTGVDLAGMFFAAAKVVAAAAVDVQGTDAIVDMSKLHERAADEGPSVFEEALDTLRSERRMLSLVAHGDGAHANLGAAVLCGLTGDRETLLDGAPVSGCAATSCKKIRGADLRLLHASDIRAAWLLLHTCNGFAVAGELYPSTTSLILGAAEGYPSAILGSDGQLSFAENEPHVWQGLLRTGRTLGEVVNFTNEARALVSDLGASVLFGDPLARLPLNGAEPGSPAELWHRELDGPPGVLDVASDGENRPEFMLSASSLVVLQSGGSGGRIDVVDRSETLSRCEQALERCAARARTAGAVERAVAEYCGGESESAGVREALLACARARRSVESRVWRALATANRCREEHRWQGSLESQVDDVREQARRWDSAFADLALRYLLDEASAGIQVGDRLYPVLHHYHRAAGLSAAPQCPRCGTPTVRRRFVGSSLALVDRIAIECGLCGPIGESSADGMQVGVEISGPLARGGGAALRVLLTGHQHGQAIALAQVRDKSKSRPFFESSAAVALSDADSVEIPFEVPLDAGFDLYSARVLVLHELDLAFARCLGSLHSPSSQPPT